MEIQNNNQNPVKNNWKDFSNSLRELENNYKTQLYITVLIILIIGIIGGVILQRNDDTSKINRLKATKSCFMGICSYDDIDKLK
jgi:uncharacterized membrane protein